MRTLRGILLKRPELPPKKRHHSRLIFILLHPRQNPLERIKPHIISKALIQPQVIPPLHRHEVAEPGMGELVKAGLGEVDHILFADWLLEEVFLIEDDQAGVLHGVHQELVHEDEVTFREGVWGFEQLLEELESEGDHLP